MKIFADLRQRARLFFRPKGQICIELSPNVVVVRPSATALSVHEGGSTACGQLILDLAQATRLGKITVHLTCKVHFGSLNEVDVPITHFERTLILKDDTFVTGAGRHLLPFSFRLGPSSPSSLTTRDLRVEYKLEAVVENPRLRAQQVFEVLVVEMDDGVETAEVALTGFEPLLGPYRLAVSSLHPRVGEHLGVSLELPSSAGCVTFRHFRGYLEQLWVGARTARTIPLFRRSASFPPNDGDLQTDPGTLIWPRSGPQGCTFSHVTTLPTCKERLRPSTSSLTRSPVRLAHRLVIELHFSSDRERYHTLRATFPIRIVSCQLVDMWPPSYSELPASPIARSAAVSRNDKCSCEREASVPVLVCTASGNK